MANGANGPHAMPIAAKGHKSGAELAHIKLKLQLKRAKRNNNVRIGTIGPVGRSVRRLAVNFPKFDQKQKNISKNLRGRKFRMSFMIINFKSIELLERFNLSTYCDYFTATIER